MKSDTQTKLVVELCHTLCKSRRYDTGGTDCTSICSGRQNNGEHENCIFAPNVQSVLAEELAITVRKVIRGEL